MTRRFGKNREQAVRRGKVTVMVALSLSLIMAAGALALDGGLLISERRHAQSVADSAAMAGAYLYFQNNVNGQPLDVVGARSAANNLAFLNGYVDSTFSVADPLDSPFDGYFANIPTGQATSNAVVVANSPPLSGNFQGFPGGYIEVIVTNSQNRHFSLLWGSSQLAVSARAVARGMFVPYTNPSPNPSTPSAGVLLKPSKSGASIDETSSLSTSPTTVVNATIDPMSALPVPNPANLVTSPPTTVTTSPAGIAYKPGVYPGGISLSAGSPITLNPGVYYMQGGGFNVGAGTVLSGSGILIYFDNTPGAGSLNIAANASVNLTPSMSGPYVGTLVFQNAASSQPITIGNSASVIGISLSKLYGTIYAPGASVKFTGGPSATSVATQWGSQIVASSLKLNNNAKVTLAPTATTVARYRAVGLVE